MKKLLLLSLVTGVLTITSNASARPMGGSCSPFEDVYTYDANQFTVNNCSSSATMVYWSINGRSYSIAKISYKRISQDVRNKTETSCVRNNTGFKIIQVVTEQERFCEDIGTDYRYQVR